MKFVYAVNQIDEIVIIVIIFFKFVNINIYSEIIKVY